MSEIPSNLKFADSHEWARIEADIATIGISDHAQEELTDVVFVELPEVGAAVDAGSPCAVVESVKTASDIYAPLSGEVIEVNEQLSDDPALVNSSPYTEGWFFKIRLSQPDQADNLLSADAYGTQIQG